MNTGRYVIAYYLTKDDVLGAKYRSTNARFERRREREDAHEIIPKRQSFIIDFIALSIVC